MTKVQAGAAIVALTLVAGGGWLWVDRFAGPGACEATEVAGGDVGGPFTLVSETGATVTEADVIDRPALVYFGYTSCPDICPMDAARNALAADLLEDRGLDVRPVFVTVDPGRDTPEVLADFTDNLHPRMLGLTGSEAELEQAAHAYRVYSKVNDDGTDTYLVDHTAFTYLMTPGGFADVFPREIPAEEMADRIECLVS